MGSGKTSTGKALAEKMGFEFADLDRVIESETQSTIAELFKDQGEQTFRKLEYDTLNRLLKKDSLVLSTGGGTACFFNAMETINKNSVSVYLKMSADSLFNRLVNERSKRPLIKDLGEKELRHFISELLFIREPYYNKAHYKVKAKEIQIGALVDFLRQENQQLV